MKTSTLRPIPLLIAGAAAFAVHLASGPAPGEDSNPPAGRMSSFKITKTDARNPFWPIGWAPGASAAPEAPAAKPVTTVSAEAFNVSSIMLGPPHVAVINGRDYAEGSAIPVNTAGGVVEVRVMAIRDGFVLLEHAGQPVKVELRRK